MKIVITKYPFFREDWNPTPSDEEKAAYVGITLEATDFVSADEMGFIEVFPVGAYNVPVHVLLMEVMKFDELVKLSAMPRWLPFADLLEKMAPLGCSPVIPISADCCEEVTTIN